MRIISSTIEPLEPGRYRLVTILQEETPRTTDARGVAGSPLATIGSGPIQSGAIPDLIVHALIQAGPPYSLTLSEIQRIVDAKTATINRQARTLAMNAPDLQIRLRGWVFSPQRGRYSLTAAAIRNLEGDRPPT